MLDLIKGFRNVYKYNTCFFVFHEALMNEFSHSSKLVLRRVLGSKCKKLGYNNGIGGDELFQTFRNEYSQTFEMQHKREIENRRGVSVITSFSDWNHQRLLATVRENMEFKRSNL